MSCEIMPSQLLKQAFHCGFRVEEVDYSVRRLSNLMCQQPVVGGTIGGDHQGIMYADAYGSSTTLAPMWSEFIETAPDSDTYFICVLQSGSSLPFCDGTMTQVNSSFYGFPPANVSFSALSAGGRFTCGLVFGSQVPVCWGDSAARVPLEYQNVSYVDIASGGHHVCALRASGFADCWGSNSPNGQTDVPRNIRFTALTSGDRFSCGLVRDTGMPLCWGYVRTNFYGLQMPNHTEFVQIASGAFHVCGVQKSTYKVFCWGSNKYEQSDPPADLEFSSVSVGNDHSCGLLRSSHRVVCWGGNSKVPPELSSLSFTTLVSGDFYNCAVGLNMELKCWGYARSATKRFESVKVAPATCRRECGEGQYPLAQERKLCPTNDYQVCIDKVQVPNVESQGLKVAVLVVLSVSVLLAVLVTVVILRRRRHSAEETIEEDLDFFEVESNVRRVESFTKQQLQRATSNYASSSALGTGSFGVVYKGTLSNGQMVAIKIAKSEQRVKAFGGELRLLARIHHSNLVNLIGYCKQDCSLVFEYMANGSLYDCLFKEGVMLDWATRLKIAAQAARGVEYLHIYANPSIIHRDIKSSNILLDEDYNAHVSDFGLSMLGPLGNLSHVTNTTLVGTPGYLDPEYFQTMHLSSKSDVYSFGVVLLELFTGRRAVDVSDSANIGIISWLSGFSNEDTPLWQALDARVPPGGAAEALLEALELAVSCTSLSGKHRPSMSSVASSLEKLLQVTRQAEVSTATPIDVSRVLSCPFSSQTTTAAHVSWESSFDQADSETFSLGPR